MTISASSSPRRQRQSRSSRQWSWRETRIATRWRSPQPADLPVHLEALGDLRFDRFLETLPRQGILKEELRPQEDPAAGGIGRVVLR
jgi:hypothetical protein